MKFLITGAAGFIGFHLSQRLLSEGYSVIGVDNLNDYYDPALKKLRLSKIKHKNFLFFECDINDLSCVNLKVDFAINLAAQAGTRLVKQEKFKYDHSNVNGFKSFCNYCLKSSIKNAIYASSSSVYDDSKLIKFSENTTELSPKSYYGMTKLFNEEFAEDFAKKHNINFLGLRFFSVYGPYGRPDMAYYSFSDAIKNNQILFLHNGGLMSRDMTYIDDIVDGIMLAIDYAIKDLDTGKHNIFNLGNDFPVKTIDLLSAIEEGFGLKATVVHKKTSSESTFTHADLTKSKEKLGYNPKILFSDGIAMFLNWYKNYENN